MMHTVALGFPMQPSDEDKENYRTFYYSLTHVLPCSTCREGYARIFEEIPIDLSGTMALFIWTVNVHNAVNRKLGHPTMDPDWVRNEYVFGSTKCARPEEPQHDRAEGDEERNRAVKIAIVVLFALAAAAVAVQFSGIFRTPSGGKAGSSDGAGARRSR